MQYINIKVIYIYYNSIVTPRSVPYPHDHIFQKVPMKDEGFAYSYMFSFSSLSLFTLTCIVDTGWEGDDIGRHLNQL